MVRRSTFWASKLQNGKQDHPRHHRHDAQQNVVTAPDVIRWATVSMGTASLARTTIGKTRIATSAEAVVVGKCAINGENERRTVFVDLIFI